MTTNGYIAANGIKYYYEVHGTGHPLLLLHGGMGSIEMFLPSVDALGAKCQVIAVEMHGHGRTELGDRPISLQDMGDDMAVIVKELGHSKVDAMGYSLGGGVAFQLAVRHPDLVRRLVLVSAGFKTEGFHPDILPMQAQMSGAAVDMMKGTPMYDSYMSLAPNPDDFPKLLDRMGDYMRKSFDMTEDVKNLKAQTMLVWGDSDMFTTPHMAEFYNLIGGNLQDAGWQRENMSPNRLAILPDHTHYDMCDGPDLVAAVLPFFTR